MIRAISVLLATIPLLAIGCQNKPTDMTPTTSYSGTLHGGMMAIGGETTGWMLVEEGQSGGLQLDVSRVRDTATRLDGTRVIVYGRMSQREYVERGPVKILVVDRIVPASR